MTKAIFPSNNASISPTALLKHWLSISKITNGSLFRKIVKARSCETYVSMLNVVWQGLDKEIDIPFESDEEFSNDELIRETIKIMDSIHDVIFRLKRLEERVSENEYKYY